MSCGLKFRMGRDPGVAGLHDYNEFQPPFGPLSSLRTGTCIEE